MKQDEPERMTWEYMQDLQRNAREWAIIREQVKEYQCVDEDSD